MYIIHNTKKSLPFLSELSNHMKPIWLFFLKYILMRNRMIYIYVQKNKLISTEYKLTKCGYTSSGISRTLIDSFKHTCAESIGWSRLDIFISESLVNSNSVLIQHT